MYDGNKEYQKRKRLRRENFVTNIKGWKMDTCAACSGSGYYDSSNSPKCSSCNGTGKEKVRPMETKEQVIEDLRKGFVYPNSDENCKYFNDREDWIKAVYAHILEEKHRKILRNNVLTLEDIVRGRFSYAMKDVILVITNHVNATVGVNIFNIK